MQQPSLIKTFIASAVCSLATGLAGAADNKPPRYEPQRGRPTVELRNLKPLPPSQSRFPQVPSEPKVSPRPEMTIRPGMDRGVAPTVTVPFRGGGQAEISGPDLHPQAQPGLNSGSATVIVPIPERKQN